MRVISEPLSRTPSHSPCQVRLNRPLGSDPKAKFQRYVASDAESTKKRRHENEATYFVNNLWANVACGRFNFPRTSGWEKVLGALHLRSAGPDYVRESSGISTRHSAGAGSLEQCLRDDV